MIGDNLSGAFAGVSFQAGAVATMRDGTRLVADVYRPTEGAGPWPVLLMRQPYGRDIASTVIYAHPTWYARQGFIVVIQDVRGRGDSEGSFYLFRHEVEDGADSVAWAAGLPDSNGRVGMYGFSYQGSTQLLAALARPPALRALAPHMTAFDLYSGWFYRNGILQLSTTLAWGSQMLREDARRRGAASSADLDRNLEAVGRLSSQFPLAEAVPITNGDLPSYVSDWLRHSHKDDYWEEFDLLARVAELGLLMHHVSGWYDMYLRGSMDGYRAMAAKHANQHLDAAPWAHIPWGPQIAGSNLGPAADPDIDARLAAWFHHWLDHETAAAEPPLEPVRYFVLGANRWAQPEAWPPPEATRQIWYLANAQRANSRFGDGTLSPAGPHGPEDLFTYDPEVPVLAPGGNFGGSAVFGPHDLSSQQQVNNLLVYTSEPLSAPLVVAGDPRCVLHVRSSAARTHFVVRLCRVTPPGRAEFLCLGAVEATARERTEITVPLDPIAVEFAVGDRIRIDVASSAFPLLARSSGTTADPARVGSPNEFNRALQVVYHDQAHPSRLLLPAVPV